MGNAGEFCELISSGAFTSVIGWKGVRVGGYGLKGSSVCEGVVWQADKETITTTKPQRITRFIMLVTNLPVSGLLIF